MGTHMTVTLFIPCFIDAMYPRAGIAWWHILSASGTRSSAPRRSSLWPPAFNSGYWEEARPIAIKVLGNPPERRALSSGSGSCGAMREKVLSRTVSRGTKHAALAQQVSSRTWEFSDFLVTSWRTISMRGFPTR